MKHWQKESGIVNIDYITALLVFLIGSIAVLGLYLSIFKTVGKIKVDEAVIGYVTEICENIDLSNYEDVNSSAKVNALITKMNLPEQYSVTCESIEKFSDYPEMGQENLVQKINLKINYSFDNNEKSFLISKIKVKE